MRAAPNYTISKSGRHPFAALTGHYHCPDISQEKAGASDATGLT